MQKQSGLTQRDRFQVAAFHTEYDLLARGEKKDSYLFQPEERLLIALCRTSDDVYDQLIAANPFLLDEWEVSKIETRIKNLCDVLDSPKVKKNRKIYCRALEKVLIRYNKALWELAKKKKSV